MRNYIFITIVIAYLATVSYGGKCDTWDQGDSTWCSSCSSFKSNVYCENCDQSGNNYGNLNGDAFTQYDCSTSPLSFTNGFCSACQMTNTVANDDGTACISPTVTLNCKSVPLSGSYTDEWCSTCDNGSDANQDASGCDHGTSDTEGKNNNSNSNNSNNNENNSTTSGSILSIVFPMLLFVASL